MVGIINCCRCCCDSGASGRSRSLVLRHRIVVVTTVFLILCFYCGSHSSYQTDNNNRERCNIHVGIVTATPNYPVLSSSHRKIVAKPILFLDVDHTLYDDRIYKIEQQIIHSIHQFVYDHYDMMDLDDILLQHRISASTSTFTTLTKYQKAQIVADYLHTQHGSTIHGLVYLLREQSRRNVTNITRKPAFVNDVPQELLSSQIQQLQKKFYETVYHPNRIDYSSLLRSTSTSYHSIPVNTGYGHSIPSSVTTEQHPISTNGSNNSNENHDDQLVPPYTNERLRQLLQSISKLYRIQLASNSPIRHVQSIVQAMGLCTVFTALPSSSTTSTEVRWWRDHDHQQVYTPDTIVVTTPNNEHRYRYPTKLQPYEFFSDVLLLQKKDENVSMTMIDDSNTICQTIQQSTIPIDMIHLDYRTESGASSLWHAICLAMGWIQHRRPAISKRQQQQQQIDGDKETLSLQQYDETFQFNDIQYLQHKNVVDLQSIHLPTYNQMLNAVIASYEESSQSVNDTHNATSITIVDVGAGVLFMVKTLLGINDNNESRLPSLLRRWQQHCDNVVNPTSPPMKLPPRHIHYYAYEPNEELYDTCHQQLMDLDFELQFDGYSSTQNQPIRALIYQKSKVLSSLTSIPTLITVHLCFCDFRSIPTIYQQSQMLCSTSKNIHESNYSSFGLYTPTNCPNLIVGCCFADLFPDPNQLISSLVRWFGIPPLDNDSEKDRLKQSLLYFPITFTGITSVYPPHPFETITCEDQSHQNIPSDTLAFRYYAKALADDHHHNLDYVSIISSVKSYGGTSLGQGTSNWIIDPISNKYLWESMMYFFGTVAAPAIQNHGWYAGGWLQRLVHNKPTIRANNVDLLFSIPFLGQWKFLQQRQYEIVYGRDQVGSETTSYNEISFTGPFEVSCKKKERNAQLKPNDVLIQSEYSLISSGTELKIFQGKFDDDALLDTTIQDFSQEKMSYPLSYGYSLVGRVIECGPHVADADILLGRRVFTFSAHASQVTTDRSNIQIVPDGIDAIDAIFLPSIETALSLVHDARLLFGENIAIFGQGLIGLLVTAVIRCQYGDNIVEISHGKFGTITTFDIVPDRLAASAQMGASQVLVPMAHAGPFDVVLEVSGNGLALQKAIDATCHAGRLIIGSWYGCDEVSLKLGIDFHRSRKTIKASQVSEIPPELSKTWTKARRFSMTWALLKQIRPSRLITLRTTIDNAQEAYGALSNGTEIAVAFEY